MPLYRSSSAPAARALIALGAAAALLAGCGGPDDHDTDTKTATIAFSGENGSAGAGADGQSVSVSVPGFSAKLAVPGLSLGAGQTSIDGIPFHPGGKITGMKITGAAGDGTGGEGNGAVEMQFTDPAAPAAVLDYYRQAARRGGWTEVPPAAGQQFAATKAKDGGTEHLAVQIGAAAQGSTGRFLILGS